MKALMMLKIVFLLFVVSILNSYQVIGEPTFINDPIIILEDSCACPPDSSRGGILDRVKRAIRNHYGRKYGRDCSYGQIILSNIQVKLDSSTCEINEEPEGPPCVGNCFYSVSVDFSISVTCGSSSRTFVGSFQSTQFAIPCELIEEKNGKRSERNENKQEYVEGIHFTITEKQQLQPTIFPNPTNGIVNINFLREHEEIAVSVYDSFGRNKLYQVFNKALFISLQLPER